MIGSLIGAGLGAAASIVGAIKAKKANDLANQELAKELDYNRAWYDRRYNEDATQRADAQRILTEAMDRIKRRNQAAAGAAAVMGSSPETVAVEKEANAHELADTASQIAAAGAARKDQIEAQSEANRQAIRAQQIGGMQKVPAAIGQAAVGVGQAAIGAGMAYDQMKEQEKQNQLLEKLYGNKPNDKLYEA